MDLHLTAARATTRERDAVDAVLTDVSVEVGDDRVVFGGLRAAERSRRMLLPALHAIQDKIGWISEGAINHLAERLAVPPAEAFGVASFYALFSTDEKPDRVAHICDDVVCSRRGGEAIAAALDDRADVHRSPCLGACDVAPAAFVQRVGEANLTVAPATKDLVRAILDGSDSPTLPPPHVGGTNLRLLRRIAEGAGPSLASYVGSGGYLGLERAIELGPAAVISEVKASGLRGRGGAAFPAGVKWEAVAAAPRSQRYVVCNADESEPGTFKDRVLLEGDPFAIIEAMTIAGFAVGADTGFLYLRGEYPAAEVRLAGALTEAHAAGYLGDDITGSGLSFDIEIRRGAGAYICGEETALFNSIEGFRGEPRQKPPFPTEAGLFSEPTVVNNVETLVNVPLIVLEGGEAFAEIGTTESSGPKLFSLSGDIGVPGVYEVDFGTTLIELIELGGGIVGELGAVLVGGAAGSFVTVDQLEVPLTFEDTRAAGISLGSGAVVVFNDATDFPAVVRRIAQFFADESCGQCVPCRVGTVRQVEALDLLAIESTGDAVRTLSDLDLVLRDASICGLGQLASTAVQSAMALRLIGDQT